MNFVQVFFNEYRMKMKAVPLWRTINMKERDRICYIRKSLFVQGMKTVLLLYSLFTNPL